MGLEFDLQEVHAIDARTRGFVTRALAVIVGTAVGVTGGYGLATGNYGAIQVVWAVAGPMCGAIVTHYFGSAGKDVR